ncbi:Fe-S cluster assembly protein SufD [uncultured Thermanaerothrix sp.]|uniref:Fe-S cluster assembly protein SufD n=1 Tax=uncultured Thermanaerothrix sp. TaxID=1195149 RepID=UPI002610A1A7|nr:Fe-S cluster assembly protein SufD [uncultured Thermanaerothrix sp.]
MTKETPEIVVRGRRRESRALVKTFTFQRAMVRMAGLSQGLRAFREQAWDLFESLPMPDPKDEAWRRTDISGLQAETFRLPEPDAHLDLAPLDENLLSPLAGEAHAGQVILLPGGVRTDLDVSLRAQGVVFTDLRTAERDHAGLLEARLGKIVRPNEGKFAAMAAALAHTGVFLYVPRGVTIEQPLHSLLWGPGVGLAHISHLVIWLEEGASVTYVHEYASPTEEGGQTLHVGLVEVYVGEGASLRFVELQSWGEHVWNFTHERVRVARQGSVDWVFGAMGGHVTKNFAELDLVGEGSSGRMSGFYFTDGDQHLDYDSQQNHLAPHTTSDLLFKGALLDRSRVVWQGMIYVAPGAFKTDGYQANRNLVLSRQARADSIPGLEILADDVRCTHGATVGKIDPEQIFYLRARGIPEVEAKRLIVEGFFDPIMQRIPFEGVRARFQEAIQRKMQNLKG